MAQRICSVDECDKPARSRGWCNPHYERWRKTGTVAGVGRYGPKVRSPLERVLAKIAIDGDCWIYPGSPGKHGHTRVGVGSSLADGFRMVGAYRVTYEAMIGPVPDGHELHHKCERPACCNPDHVVPLTHEAHMNLHGTGPCKRCGADEWTTAGGFRRCLPCQRKYRRAYGRSHYDPEKEHQRYLRKKARRSRVLPQGEE